MVHLRSALVPVVLANLDLVTFVYAVLSLKVVRMLRSRRLAHEQDSPQMPEVNAS